ncbi:YciI family protein [Humibacter ginsengisoli]
MREGRDVDARGRDAGMKYMLMLRASARDDGDSGAEPARKAMAAYDEQLIRAGVLLAGERLDLDAGARVSCDGERRYVSDAQDSEPPIAMWMLQVASRDEAVEWARRCPATDGCIEVRGIVERSETDVRSDAIANAR